jgi:hypothetical protein
VNSTESNPILGPPPGPQNVPSLRSLAMASGIALVVASLILVVAVLPAEYGIDPLGAGRVFGFSALSQPAQSLAPVPPPEGDTLAPVQQGAVALYPGEYKFDSREFVLGPYEYLEYKYHLAKDATMLFSWTADGDVIHDMHGDPDGAPADAAQSFDKQPRRRADGSFTAPFSGIHGWFWENPGGETITVRVTTAGFYTAAHEFRFDGTRQGREVRAINSIPVADN